MEIIKNDNTYPMKCLTWTPDVTRAPKLYRVPPPPPESATGGTTWTARARRTPTASTKISTRFPKDEAWATRQWSTRESAACTHTRISPLYMYVTYVCLPVRSWSLAMCICISSSDSSIDWHCNLWDILRHVICFHFAKYCRCQLREMRNATGVWFGIHLPLNVYTINEYIFRSISVVFLFLIYLIVYEYHSFYMFYIFPTIFFENYEVNLQKLF